MRTELGRLFGSAMLIAIVAGCALGPEPRAGYDALTLDLLEVPSAQLGKEVVFTAELSNASDESVTVLLGGGPYSFDPVVSDESGRMVWRHWHGVVTAEAQFVRVDPGRSVTFSAVWDLRDLDGQLVQPGNYTVHGEFHTALNDPLRTEAQTIVVSAP